MTHGDPAKGGRHGDEGLKIGREGLQPVFDFLDKAKKDGKPFFVWYAPMMPHSPHNPPETAPQQVQGQDQVDPRRPLLGHVRMVRRDGRRTAARSWRRTARPRTPSSIYLHDNGWIQDPGFAALRPEVEAVASTTAGVRTPIIIRWPGHVKPGESSDRLAVSVDLAPTILHAVGGKPTQEHAGHQPARPARRSPAAPRSSARSSSTTRWTSTSRPRTCSTAG